MRPIGTATLNRIDLQVELNYEIAEPGADFVFNIHAAQTSSQSLSGERLVLGQSVVPQMHIAPSTRDVGWYAMTWLPSAELSRRPAHCSCWRAARGHEACVTVLLVPVAGATARAVRATPWHPPTPAQS